MNNNTTKKIETRSEIIWLTTAGIMYYEAKPVEEHSLEDARENIDAAKKILKGKSAPSLIDLRKIKHISLEAKNLYISKENSPVKACAFLVNSFMGIMIGNFFIRLNKAFVPTKIFHNEIKALKWLEQFKTP